MNDFSPIEHLSAMGDFVQTDVPFQHFDFDIYAFYPVYLPPPEDIFENGCGIADEADEVRKARLLEKRKSRTDIYDVANHHRARAICASQFQC